ncbi:hypothetical protein QQF64_033800 [Cirrhinus molitorella]|uniref:Uncharacterized protein n=1 Tax=Cirrhinus molitorella TaxID=172907 RepID=A0ABR3MUX9_9TELE
MEKETDNEEDRESGQKIIEEQTQGQSSTWTPMELTSSFKDFVERVEKKGQVEKEQNKKKMGGKEKEKVEEIKKDKAERQTRRQIIKVTPNLELARRKVMKKGRVKYLNQYEVLRGLEEED